jgi:hypothetical protein
VRITTRDAIEITESLASYLLSSYLYNVKGEDPSLERRMKYVKTAKYTVADVYYRGTDMAIEVKSTEHGNDALKGVVQASVYKEQSQNGVLCMQKPSRRNLSNVIEGFAESYGVGVVWITRVPTVCDRNTIASMTGGCSKPFELWRGSTFTRTRQNIISNSKSDDIVEYLDTIDTIMQHKYEDIFEFAVAPNSDVPGLYYLHNGET